MTDAATLVEAAAGLVAVHGVAGTHLASVARAAGVAVGTVYTYFPSKAALLAAVAQRIEYDVVDAMAAAAPTDALLRPALPELASQVLRTVMSSPAPRLLAERDIPARAAPTSEHGAVIRGWIAERVRRAQHVGEVAEVDPDLVAVLSFALVVAAADEIAAGRQREELTAPVSAALLSLVPPVDEQPWDPPAR